MLSSCPSKFSARSAGASSSKDFAALSGSRSYTLAARLAALAAPKQFAVFVQKLRRQDWVVYAKAAFGGPGAVLRYLGRYTHRVAISNHRLVAHEGDQVTFRWKDYA